MIARRRRRRRASSEASSDEAHCDPTEDAEEEMVRRRNRSSRGADLPSDDSQDDERCVLSDMMERSRSERRGSKKAVAERINFEERLALIKTKGATAIKELTIELEDAQSRAAHLASGLLVAIKNEDASSLAALLARAERDMTSVDREVLDHLLRHIVHPGAQYSPLMQDVSVHFANVLGMQEFLTLGAIFRLPKETWLRGQRRILRELIHVGWMFRQIDVWCMSHDLELWLVESDATRIVQKLEACVKAPDVNYLLGPCFPPSPLHHPRLNQLPPIPSCFEELKQDIGALYSGAV